MLSYKYYYYYQSYRIDMYVIILRRFKNLLTMKQGKFQHHL